MPMVVACDTSEYNVYISRVGDYKLGATDERIVKQPYSGVMFKSSNNRTWSPLPNGRPYVHARMC